MTSRADLRHIAARIRTAGELLERSGEHAWSITRQWQAGPSAANFEAVHGQGTTSDPTGDTALATEPDPHAALVACIEGALRAADDLVFALQRVGEPPPTRWCWWHEQIGVRETAPSNMSIDGKPASRWAYDHWRRTGKPPTPEQTRRRVEGGRNRSVA